MLRVSSALIFFLEKTTELASGRALFFVFSTPTSPFGRSILSVCPNRVLLEAEVDCRYLLFVGYEELLPDSSCRVLFEAVALVAGFVSF